MNDSNYKKIKHHQFPGDIPTKQKIIRRELSIFSGKKKQEEAIRLASEPVKKSKMRQCQQERTRAVLKEQEKKLIEIEVTCGCHKDQLEQYGCTCMKDNFY